MELPPSTFTSRLSTSALQLIQRPFDHRPIRKEWFDQSPDLVGQMKKALPKLTPVVGLATLAMDQGVQDSEISREGRVLRVYAELSSGVVRDFYYHDSEMKGHDESETLLLKGHSLLKQGKTQEAIQILEKSVALNPANHRALNTLAWTLIDLNIDLEKGVRYAEQAVQVFPDSPYNEGTLGCGYYKKGDLEKAEKYLRLAVNLFPVYEPQDARALAHDKAIDDNEDPDESVKKLIEKAK